MNNKKIWFSERKKEPANLDEDKLVDEIRKVTNVNVSAISKIHEIKYLLKHYFKIKVEDALAH